MKKYLLIVLGSMILSFGIYNIHYQCGIAEGGELGLELLLKHYFDISPATTSFIFDSIFFVVGIFVIKNNFAFKAIIGTISYSISYYVFEAFPPVIPNLSELPLIAALIGAVFVGVGAGIVVKLGGASGGDDSLALILSKMTKLPISICYFVFDFIIIILSLSYIPFNRLIYSFLTALLSSFIIGKMQRIKIYCKKK